MRVTQSQRHAAIQSLFSEAPDSSSFGPIGHIAPVSAGRVKGFIGPTSRQDIIVPVSTPEHVQFISDVVTEAMGRLNQDITRLSLRVVAANREAVSMLRTEIQSGGLKVEAVVPTPGGSIVYIGFNAQRRGAHVGNVEEALEAFENGSASIFNAARDIAINRNSYSILPILEGTGPRVFNASQIDQIHSLLGVFNGNNHGATVESLLNPHNIIGLVQNNENNEIVGITVVEIRKIPLSNGDTIVLAELTDGKVSDQHGGRNLYARAVNEMFRTIASNHRNVDVVFAESNISNVHLMEIAGMQGRKRGGVLEAHAKITDPKTGVSNLKSFMVTYLPIHEVGQAVSNLDLAISLQEGLRD